MHGAARRRRQKIKRRAGGGGGILAVDADTMPSCVAEVKALECRPVGDAPRRLDPGEIIGLSFGGGWRGCW
eukprot:4248497-Pyramimonas_sp.AAC.1